MVVSRRALAGLVALGGAGVVLRRDGGGSCPRPGRDPGVETRSRNDREDVDGRLWETATVAGWRTDTGLRFTGSLSGDYLDYDGPEGLGSSRQDFAEMPKLVHEDDDCVVVQAGLGCVRLSVPMGGCVGRWRWRLLRGWWPGACRVDWCGPMRVLWIWGPVR